MPTGKVKFFSAEKGFGFLSYDDGEDVFVHRDALPEGVTELKKGQRVEFEAGVDPRNPGRARAENVRPIAE